MDTAATVKDVRALVLLHTENPSYTRDWWSQLAEVLMSATKQAAQAAVIRESFGSFGSLWLDMGVLWEAVAAAIYQGELSTEIRQGCLYLARFTRNLVAGVAQNQERSLWAPSIFILTRLEQANSPPDRAFEPAIQRILFQTTSFFMMQDADWNSVTAALIQTLSNMATENEAIRSALWSLYLNLKEEENIVIRSLASPDKRTVITTLVLILNCVRGNMENISQLATKPCGIQMCRAVLDRANDHVEQFEGEDYEDETFTISFRLFQAIFESQVFSRLWTSLTKCLELCYDHLSSSSEEPITPHQTILLKLLDSYLQSTSRMYESSDLGLITPLAEIHLELSDAARAALGGTDGRPLSAENQLTIDHRLPALITALVLTSQCITSLLLSEQENKLLLRGLKAVKGIRSKDGMSLVEECIDLLQRLDTLLPRIILGRAQYVSNFDSSVTATAANDDRGPTGFEYIKRDLVRLLGVLCHEDQEIQDSIRERGGIPLIMNMCVIDERNPCECRGGFDSIRVGFAPKASSIDLREHALFALRNLLQDNPKNKKLVDDMKPLDRWEAEGRLV